MRWSDARDGNECVSTYETTIVFNSRAFDLIRHRSSKCDIKFNEDELIIVFSESGKYKINQKGKRINNPSIKNVDGFVKGKFKIVKFDEDVMIIDTSGSLPKRAKSDFSSNRTGRRWNPRHMEQFEHSEIWENPKG